MLNVLLTGSRGMVGRNILEHPGARKLRVLTPSRQELDLRDKRGVLAYLSAHRPDLIIHAAGKVGGISANMADPYGFLLQNMEIGTNLISCAVEVGIERMLNLASSCIYPKDVDGTLSEDMVLAGRLEPTNEGYALAKIATLRLCQFSSAKNPRVRYKTLIPCNLYGPHDNFELQSAHLIPAIIHKVHQAKVDDCSSVEIWGDGSARREFMYAGDLADAVLRAALDFDAVPDLMNVGLGHDHSVLDYYQAVAAVIGWQGTFTFDLGKPAGMRRKLVDTSRQRAWGFQASTPLEAGIRATYDHFLQGHPR